MIITMIKRFISFQPLALFLSVILLTACSGNSGRKADSDSLQTETGDYHADNDIAMIIRSIMDAMNVDQPLDSAEYNYNGILTDGSGRPLYTDIQGSPGQWTVEVLSPNRALLKNLYLGDLVPEELAQYIMASLEVPDSLMIMEQSPNHHIDSRVSTYDFGKGQMILEITEAKTESGDKGPLVNILLLKK